MSNKQSTPLEELDLDSNATPEDAQLRHQILSAFFHAPLDASSQLKGLSNNLIDSIDTAYAQLPKPQASTNTPPPIFQDTPPPGPSPTPPGPSPEPPGPTPTPPTPPLPQPPGPTPQPQPQPSGPNGWVVLLCIVGFLFVCNGIYSWLQPKPPEPTPIPTPTPTPSPSQDLDKDDPAYSPEGEPTKLLYFYFWSLSKDHFNHAFNCWDSKWQSTSLISGKQPRDAFRINHLDVPTCPDFDSLPADTYTEQGTATDDTTVIRVNAKPFDIKNARYFDYTLVKEDGKWRIHTVSIIPLPSAKQALWSYFNAMYEKRWDDAINAYTASYRLKNITTTAEFSSTHSAFFLCKPLKDLPSGTFTVIESGDDKQVIQVNTDPFELKKRTINYTLVKDGDDWKIDAIADLSTPDTTGTNTGTTTGTTTDYTQPPGPSPFQTETMNTLKQLQAEMDFVSDRMKTTNRRWSPILQDMQSAGQMMSSLQQQIDSPPVDAWGRPINLPPDHAQYYRDSLIQRYNAQQARYNDLARGSQDCANEYLDSRQRYDTALGKYNNLAPQIGWSQLQSNCPAPLGPTGQ